MKQRLLVKMTKDKGRGVFANCPIKKGEIVEIAPVIVLTEKEQKKLWNQPLGSYFYAWGLDGELSALVLGLASLYNHSYKPNIHYYHRIRTSEIVFKALRDIGLGEELTHNYVCRGEHVVFTKTGWYSEENRKRKR